MAKAFVSVCLVQTCSVMGFLRYSIRSVANVSFSAVMWNLGAIYFSELHTAMYE